MKILTVDEMRDVEKECSKIGLSTDVLMENAGRAVAEEAKNILGAINQQDIVVLIGPGNNGGDGLVVARYLHDWGAKVSFYLIGRRPPDDPNLDKVRQRGIVYIEAAQDNLERLDEWLSGATGVIDAIFGIGRTRPIDGITAEVLNRVSVAKERQKGLRIIAVDLPSGLDADSGTVDPACAYADNTITLGFPKLGLLNFPGAERTGKITVVDIGIPCSLVKKVSMELITDSWA
ncbi:NAD(P)H-hydrate epimerase, partial [Chloroflexota bacterium]